MAHTETHALTFNHHFLDDLRQGSMLLAHVSLHPCEKNFNADIQASHDSMRIVLFRSATKTFESHEFWRRIVARSFSKFEWWLLCWSPKNNLRERRASTGCLEPLTLWSPAVFLLHKIAARWIVHVCNDSLPRYGVANFIGSTLIGTSRLFFRSGMSDMVAGMRLFWTFVTPGSAGSVGSVIHSHDQQLRHVKLVVNLVDGKLFTPLVCKFF